MDGNWPRVHDGGVNLTSHGCICETKSVLCPLKSTSMWATQFPSYFISLSPWKHLTSLCMSSSDSLTHDPRVTSTLSL